MKLQDLEIFDSITIQGHDNPDADSLASGYGLYCYFKEKGKNVRLVYSGNNQIQKSNRRLMVDELHIPVEYIQPQKEPIRVEGLLLTVDCQYGGGNVSKIEADAIAVVDHHQIDSDFELSIIRPHLGSCATVVWQLLLEAGFTEFEENNLGTALYYGLYTDTNQFAELHNPLDMDMREALVYDKSLITLFRNSNLSLKELEVAGIAMIRYSFNDDYEFAVIKSQPCDPNLLGLISDFLLQVDVIKTCVVFNETPTGYKFSVRSCIRQVDASELAAYLADKMGSGGGHYEKAGGFIGKKKYEDYYPTTHAEAYFNNRMVEYFDSFETIDALKYECNVDEMLVYEKRKIPVGYVKIAEVLPEGTPITIRTLEGDAELTVEKDLYIIVGIKGEVYPNRREKFEQAYLELEKKYDIKECCPRAEYVPTIKNRADGTTLSITDYAKVCVPTGQVKIYAKPLEKGVKVFTAWNKDKYMLGREGDYLAVRCDDLHDVYVVEKDIFEESYDELLAKE